MAHEMAGLRAAKKEVRTLMRRKLSQMSTESVKQQSAVAAKTLMSLPEYKNAQRIGIYLSMPQCEISTKDIVYHGLREGRKVFVPYIYKFDVQGSVKPGLVMNMLSLHSLSDYENLSPDAWGIPSISEESVDERYQVLNAQSDEVERTSQQKPSGNKTSSRTESTERLDVIVMPGVAFDKSLGRLGHGKGFYDYFLDRYHCSMAAPMPFLGTCISSIPHVVSDSLSVGLSLDRQLLPDGQSVPTDASDYKLDALIVGDGTIVRS